LRLHVLLRGRVLVVRCVLVVRRVLRLLRGVTGVHLRGRLLLDAGLVCRVVADARLVLLLLLGCGGGGGGVVLLAASTDEKEAE